MNRLPSDPLGGVAPVVLLPFGQAEPLHRQIAENLALVGGGQLVGQEEAGERVLKGQVGGFHGALPAQCCNLPTDIFCLLT
jgi:hypothetical protein